MFCAKCGKEISPGGSFCPGCGNESVSPVIDKKSESSTNNGTQLSIFFKEYFENPISAVSKHAKNEFWVWGLLSLSAYLLIHFFITVIGVGSISGVGYQFGYFIGDIIRFATLVFAYYFFQNVFNLKKKSLQSVIAVIGLAFLPLLPVYIVGLAFDRIILYSNILSGAMTAVYAAAGIILYSELKESSDDHAGFKSLLTVAVSFACMPIVSGIIDAIVSRIYYASIY